ncbi:hypothetical protein AB9K41_05965, partial [Cribrihabitans sp. XS_ASV171]
MTLTVISSDITALGAAFSPISGSTNLILEGVTVTSTGGTAIVNNVLNLSEISVNVGGTVAGYDTGIRLNSDNAFAQGHSVVVQETGSVLSDQSYAVSIEGYRGSLTNSGEIYAAREAAVYMDGSIFTLENYGIIASLGPSDNGASAIRTTGGVTDGLIVNHGVLSAKSEYAATVHLYNSAGPNQIVNTGQIKSGGTAILGSAGRETVTNSGVIQGNVDLFTGDDIFDGRGGTVIG